MTTDVATYLHIVRSELAYEVRALEIKIDRLDQLIESIGAPPAPPAPRPDRLPTGERAWFRCPVCDHPCKTPQGVRLHQQRSHPDTLASSATRVQEQAREGAVAAAFRTVKRR